MSTEVTHDAVPPESFEDVYLSEGLCRQHWTKVTMSFGLATIVEME